MIRSVAGGVPHYVFEGLADQEQLVHAVFTRLGGVSAPPYQALNVGHSVGDDPLAVEANHDLIFKAFHLSRADVVTAHQVHSNHVAVVDQQDSGRVIPETDALMTEVPGIYLLMRFADCLPVFLYDPEEQVVAIGHAGWRGTAATLASRMIHAMKVSFGSEPARLVASLGPAIGPCCYRVGEEVVEAIKPTLEHWGAALQRREDGDWSLDLWEANRQQLMGHGVRRIETGRICTACHAAEFFSHRADRGTTGRFAALIGIRKPA